MPQGNLDALRRCGPAIVLVWHFQSKQILHTTRRAINPSSTTSQTALSHQHSLSHLRKHRVTGNTDSNGPLGGQTARVMLHTMPGDAPSLPYCNCGAGGRLGRGGGGGGVCARQSPSEAAGL